MDENLKKELENACNEQEQSFTKNSEEEPSVQIEMPKYQSHKKVWALKIKELGFAPEGHGAIIIPENKRYAEFLVNNDYCNKHKPEAGGYYVVYEDGYKSFSPAQAFESGYTEITPIAEVGCERIS